LIAALRYSKETSLYGLTDELQQPMRRSSSRADSRLTPVIFAREQDIYRWVVPEGKVRPPKSR